MRNIRTKLEIAALLATILGTSITAYSLLREPSRPITPDQLEPLSRSLSKRTTPQSVKPSFDCDQATWPTEHIVCSSNVLSILDLALSNAYRDAVARNPRIKVELRNQQRIWMRQDRERCSNVECLKDAYEERIDELESR